VSLDLTKIASQAVNMVTRLKDGRAERQQRLDYARQIFGDEAIDLEKLKRKIAASRTTWLVAELADSLSERFPAPPLPAGFSVLATDGSHIDVDRHRSTRCYLINIGAVALKYGDETDAMLDSVPHLYAEDEELVIKPAAATGREQMVEGTLLGIKRAVEECRQLSKLAGEQESGSSTLALLDGTLILWGLEAYPDFVAEALLDQGFLPCLEEMRKQNNDKKVALASYISFPRSTDVVNVLRVAICPHEVADCDRFCPPHKDRDCEGVAGVNDRELFMDALEPGERSALFISPSKITKERYGGHRIYFFYLRLEEEVARVETPRWVAENPDLLQLTHALILDQCRRGQGYPVALSEAHEQAVVTAADRTEFWQLVESLCVDEKIPTLTSAKSFSKKTRWV
jgi:hypothetical protein